MGEFSVQRLLDRGLSYIPPAALHQITRCAHMQLQLQGLSSGVELNAGKYSQLCTRANATRRSPHSDHENVSR